ncbi:integrase, catalytic region, zinc finger, CCHC-type containing protein [Tanacetum coccineum]|uniref:Integrase, catalytic region, zinc finger, CCHC-type containing protein n=1 Tax=Tanacetum coccineum TaxID=301880 RepID=A0ABQ5AKJ9_9ASTR
MSESPFIDSGFVGLVFSPEDDLIACLNKEMAFLTAVASSRFPTTNNQLRTSFNLRNQATIQEGRVTVQQVQGRQGQNYSGTAYKNNATSSIGNTASGIARVVKCYNCQGEGHMARQCTQPKRTRNAAWYKEKAMLVEAQKARQILDEEQLAFLADSGIPASQTQTVIPHNAAFQTEDLDTYDSDCDDLSTKQAVLMANISQLLSDVIQKLAVDQAFWFHALNPTIKPSYTPPVIVDAPSKLPKVSLVNASLKKLKFHLAQFDSVVKKRTTPSALEEGELGCVLHLDAEFSKSKQAYNALLKSHSQLEKHCISLEVSNQLNQEIFQKDESCINQNALEIPEYFEKNDLKAQLQDKDTTICKLKDIIKSMREKSKDDNVNNDLCELETKNVELENSVAKLLYDNERLCNEINHVKQLYKDQLTNQTNTCSS